MHLMTLNAVSVCDLQDRLDETVSLFSYWTTGISWMVGYVCVYLLISIVLGLAVQMGGVKRVEDKVRLPRAV